MSASLRMQRMTEYQNPFNIGVTQDDETGVRWYHDPMSGLSGPSVTTVLSLRPPCLATWLADRGFAPDAPRIVGELAMELGYVPVSK